MGLILFVGVGLGFLAAIVAATFLARRILATMMAGEPARRRTMLKGAAAGAVIAFFPALLLGTVIGATLGGTYGGALAAQARDSGALAGVMLGVFAVAAPLLLGSIWLGARIGRWLADQEATGSPTAPD
jgi:hypothetical protein